MRIKKKGNNEYLLTEDGLWVRNFCRLETTRLDLNNDLSKKDYGLFLKNEFLNRRSKFQNFEVRPNFNNIVIVSDGYDFSKKQEILANLPFKEVAIIATNGALANWKLVGKQCPIELQRAITWYVVNNPYPECKRFFPTKHSYYPPCVASSRTNPEFTSQYRGGLMLYYPVTDSYYSGLSNSSDYSIDDYRNPICAAIGLSFRLGVKKLLLFCCDDSFENERPASVQLENGLWTYPQQIISQNIIDANLFWLKSNDVTVGNCSSGKKIDNATYIALDQVIGFFNQ